MQSKELPVVTNGCKGLCCVAFYFGGKLDETMTDKTVVDGEKREGSWAPSVEVPEGLRQEKG